MITTAKTRSTKLGLFGAIVGLLAVVTYFTPVGVLPVGLPLSVVGLGLGFGALVATPRNVWLAAVALLLSALSLAFVATMLALGIKC